MPEIKKATALFKNYQKEIDSTNPDLKKEIQDQQRIDLTEKYSKLVGQARNALQTEAEMLKMEREKASDPMIQVAINAVNKAADVSPGDAALVASVGILPEHMLQIVAEKTRCPAVQLALLGRVQGKDQGELRQTILKNVTLPNSQIKGLAERERSCLNALIIGTNLPGESVTEKLDYGHRLEPLKEILATKTSLSLNDMMAD